ncbi:FAD-dependent oxidoreductase [Rhizobiales bacterium RZME27]|uniref:FAD-dependent oxidoreductase n=1 Tax=Endobacterium cereale TaxID=2663029 RepID=A0A6A8A8U4_9HYPH|nr:FAD-dependent oxidoreductase [Endobacterium cereale]MEB2843218.1 FAD-dependent oxidoreductase [Endobacterium cereale]MQY47179.1 FAD-dependent oxidoreductase [Endobacterium cereale]
MDGHFKYIIIGCGMMGAAAARHLSTWTDGVAVIGPAEPAETVSHEGVFASHYDEARITRTIDPDAVWARLANRSIARYDEIAKESGVDFYSEVGCLVVGPQRDGDTTYVGCVEKAAAQLGVATENMGDARLRESFPYFSFPNGSDGIFEEKSAGHINPRRLVKAQTIQAERQGATVIRQTVVSTREEAGRVTVATAEGKTYTAEKVLVAAGGFSIAEKLLGARLDLKVFARTVSFFEIDEAQMEAYGKMPSLIWKWTEEDDGIYMLPPVRYPDGKLYLKIGGDPDDVELKTEPEIRDWFRSGGRESTNRHLTEVVGKLVPDVDLSRNSMAACVTSFTPTDYPAIAMTSARMGVLTGGCGAAAKSSDEIGRLGAELLFRGRIEDDAYGAANGFPAHFL